MTSPSSAKRQRTEGSDPGDTMKPHLWFDDGNVVLQAEKTVFRVHKSVLGFNSTFFSDFFSTPLPGEDEEPQHMFEGALCIYDNRKKYAQGRDTMDCQYAASLYSSGAKYGVDFLRQEIERRLKIEYPSTLKDWDRSFTGTDVFTSENKDEFALLINVAREKAKRVVLPAMYAALSRLGNVTLLRMRDSQNLNPWVLETCLVGTEKLVSAMQQFLLAKTMALDTTQECLKEAQMHCSRHLSTVIWGVTKAICNDGGVKCLDPLNILRYSSQAVCKDCFGRFKEIYEEMRQHPWHRLPSFFGLPDWTELRRGDA
ncbi:hypothetical protein CPC08DRAFT_724361 [Agrocybe pediades]|nr:hypothetical protein CPC08DRAFT_724361 [Agrocybe pediades]